MNKLRPSGLSIIHKFLIFLCFLFIVAFTDSILFIKQSREIALYDDLDYRINNAKISMIELEFILDMFIVARHFEGEKIELITTDVRKIDQSIQEIEAIGYTKFGDNTPIFEGIKALVEDWQTIKNEFRRLDEALSYDVILLIHNSVDMNALLFSEKIEKLSEDIARSRHGVYKNIVMMVMGSLAVSLLIILAASVFFISSALLPVRRLAVNARAIISGEDGVSIKEYSSGEGSSIAKAFNKLIEDAKESRRLNEAEHMGFIAEIDARGRDIETLTEVVETAGASLSRSEIFNCALNGAVVNSGADAGAIYMSDTSGALKLSVSAGIGSGLREDVLHIPQSERFSQWGVSGSTTDIEVKDIEDYPDGTLKNFMHAGNFTAVAIVPIPYDKAVVGTLVLEFVDAATFDRNSSAFLRSTASLIGSLAGYLDLFYDEHKDKDFSDRILHQMPLGLAVFDKDGAAVMINDTLKSMLGIGSETDFVRRYKLVDDNLFDMAGVLSLLDESYHGHRHEMVLDYNPMRLTWYDFTGDSFKLKLRSFPLYDASGSVTGIVLLYENITASDALVSAQSGLKVADLDG